MIGAIAGDIIGSIYEASPIKTKAFPLFGRACSFTDDSVLTVAVAHVILEGGSYSDRFRDYYRRYPYAGYGGSFHDWACSSDPKPYGSFGNGSAMRVGPVAFAFDDLETVLAEAKRSAEVTHNHPEGLKGAQATAAAIFLARRQTAKEEIRLYVERTFGYDLTPTLDQIRPDYTFDVTCQGTVPPALISFLEANDFEDAVRNAISLGGDSDTLACIAGSIAGAYYGVSPYIELESLARLDNDLREVTDRFMHRFVTRHTQGNRGILP
jgi:ADP-ribosylglycohydrolase